MIQWINRYTIISLREPSPENKVKWARLSRERKEAYLKRYPNSWYAKNKKWGNKKVEKPSIKNNKKKEVTPHGRIKGIIKKNFANKFHEHFGKFKKAFNKSHPELNNTKLATHFRKNFMKNGGSFNSRYFKDFINPKGNFDSKSFHKKHIEKPQKEILEIKEPTKKIEITAPEKLKTEVTDMDKIHISNPVVKSFVADHLPKFEAMKRSFNNIEEYNHMKDNTLADLFHNHFEKDGKFHHNKFDSFIDKNGEFDPDQFRDYVISKKNSKPQKLKMIDLDNIEKEGNKETEKPKEEEDEDNEEDQTETPWVNTKKRIGEKARKFAMNNSKNFMQFKMAFNKTHKHIPDKSLVNLFNDSFNEKGKFHKKKYEVFLDKEGKFDSDQFDEYMGRKHKNKEIRSYALNEVHRLHDTDLEDVSDSIDELKEDNDINDTEKKHRVRKVIRTILATVLVGVLGAAYWHMLPATHELLGQLWTTIAGDKDERHYASASNNSKHKQTNNLKWLIKKIQRWVKDNPKLVEKILEKYRKES